MRRDDTIDTNRRVGRICMTNEQARAKKRHESILDAALRVFAKKGYRDAAVDDIAVESKTSKGGVYFHFPGKQAIFLELLDRTAARLRSKIEEAIAAETDPIRKADAALLVVLRTFASHRALARLFMIEALGAGKEFHQRLSQIHEEFAAIIKVQLDQAVAEGAIPPLDTHVAATAWFGALNEVMMQWLLSGKPARLQDAYDSLRPLLIRSVGVIESAPQQTFEDQLRTALESTLSRALEAARRDHQPMLACVTLPCPGFDPISVYTNAADSRRIFWQQPSEGVAMVAAGEAARITASGQSRFDDARTEWRRLVEGAVANPAAAPFEAPVALAGFAFAPAAGAQDLPDSLLVVPRLLFTSLGRDSWLTVATKIGDASDLARESALIQDEVATMLRPAIVADAEPAGVCLVDTHDRERWQAATAAAIAELGTGALEKLVLARAVPVRGDVPIDVTAALQRLGGRYRTTTVFAFDLGEAVFFGATPERLLRIQDGVVSVDCLAGSISRGEGEADDRALASRLLHDPKELHEHKVVVSAVEEALSPLCATLEFGRAPRIVSFPNVHHLYTPVSGTAMPGHDVFEFVESLHPTPATGGQPRQAALDRIPRYETFDRGWYAGPRRLGRRGRQRRLRGRDPLRARRGQRSDPLRRQRHHGRVRPRPRVRRDEREAARHALGPGRRMMETNAVRPPRLRRRLRRRAGPRRRHGRLHLPRLALDAAGDAPARAPWHSHLDAPRRALGRFLRPRHGQGQPQARRRALHLRHRRGQLHAGRRRSPLRPDAAAGADRGSPGGAARRRRAADNRPGAALRQPRQALRGDAAAGSDATGRAPRAHGGRPGRRRRR